MNDLLISKNGKYIVSSEFIVDTDLGISTSVNSPNPIFVCEMMKNQSIFTHKNSLMENKDLFNKIRKLSYKLLESDSNLVMEYEIKFGQKMLFESIENVLTEQTITESWDFIKNKLIGKYGVIIEEGLWDWVKDKANSAWEGTKKLASGAWEGIKNAASWVVSKGIPWFMEKLENFMLSPVGIGLDVALTALGIGKLATGILWGILLCWKIYQVVSGKSDASSVWTYIDIAVCLAGLIFSGAAKGLKMAFKSAGGNIAKVGGKVLSPIIKVLTKGASGIINLLLKPFEWIAKIFGSKASALISSVKSGIGKILEKISNLFAPAAAKAGVPEAKGLGQVVKSGLKKDFVQPLGNVTRKSLTKAGTKGLKWGGGVALANTAIGKVGQMYAKNNTPSPEDYQKITSAIPDDTIKQGVEGDMNDLLKQMS